MCDGQDKIKEKSPPPIREADFYFFVHLQRISIQVVFGIFVILSKISDYFDYMIFAIFVLLFLLSGELALW